MATLTEAFDAADDMASSLGRRWAEPAEAPPEVARVRAERAIGEAARQAVRAGMDLDELSRLLGTAWARARAGG